MSDFIDVIWGRTGSFVLDADGRHRGCGDVARLTADDARRFIEAGDASPADSQPLTESASADEDLESLTVAQLRELASERGVVLAASMRKSDIIEALG
jgi:hypothetical protein